DSVVVRSVAAMPLRSPRFPRSVAVTGLKVQQALHIGLRNGTEARNTVRICEIPSILGQVRRRHVGRLVGCLGRGGQKPHGCGGNQDGGKDAHGVDIVDVWRHEGDRLRLTMRGTPSSPLSSEGSEWGTVVRGRI